MRNVTQTWYTLSENVPKIGHWLLLRTIDAPTLRYSAQLVPVKDSADGYVFVVRELHSTEPFSAYDNQHDCPFHLEPSNIAEWTYLKG